MRDLNFLDRYTDYAAAARRAKALAAEFGEDVYLRRARTGAWSKREGTEDAWFIYASNRICMAQGLYEYEFEEFLEERWIDTEVDLLEDDTEVDLLEDEEYLKEVIGPLIEEMFEDQENWARSEEDGWYYLD